MFKRAYNRIKESKSLLLVSLNPAYQPYEVPIKEVLEVLKLAVQQRIRVYLTRA